MRTSFILDDFQERAIRAAYNGDSVIVCAPTGAGKTLIAEEVINYAIANRKGVIYTAPIKALSNQKFRDFSKKYPGQVGILTGDVSINRNAPILIMTTEIFRNSILVNPDEFKYREWVIFDEIHYLDDIERGTVWEEAIILLPENVKMLALSATIPNIDEFVGWIRTVHKHNISVIIEEKRPVPLHFMFQCNNEIIANYDILKKNKMLGEEALERSYKRRYGYRDRRSYENNAQISFKPNKLSSLIEFMKNDNKLPCIYFCFSRRRCEEMAEMSARFNLLTNEESKAILAQYKNLLKKFDASASIHCDYLEPLLKQGIAYHHAGLLPTLKEIIERLFATGLIKLIFSTETFALGINMPAKTVVFDALRKFYGHYHDYLKTRDFYQMAGRSGRRGIDIEGFVVSRINPSDISFPNLEKVLFGNYEFVKSQLQSCYATILNLYRIMGERIMDIYPKSFHCYQSREAERKEVLSLFKRKIAFLKELRYIDHEKITSKAELASKVYSFEIAIGELFKTGFLENLSEEDLFITVTALVYEPRKGQKKPHLNKHVKRLCKELYKLMNNIHRFENNFKIAPLSKHFFFHLNEIALRWYRGVSFSVIVEKYDIDEGEVVRYFRMAIQVMREIADCEVISPILRRSLRNCIAKTNRDEINAEAQLTSF
ncbi:MAG: DEAD/DEAH box helicase [Candidatus Omnitrophica bacterium]|nr:DEAD/DEAH box helicase [Candidatus Omnitrophota bacterium]